MTRETAVLAALGALWGAACAGGPRAAADVPRADVTGLDGGRWTWVSANCVDGPLEVGAVGFERELRIEVAGEGLLFTYDDALAARGCTRTSVWRATSDADGVRLEPQAIVTLPVDAACGPEPEGALRGTLRRAGDALELIEARSPWCRGLDAHFVYRRLARAPLDSMQIVRRWVAHFDRRDATTLAHLFAETGALVEPFTPTDDGAYRRHEGRRQVRAWLDAAFASTPWLAMRLTGVEPSDDPGGLVARWEYMDANLAEPVAGRNLFVLAGGEIYETEIQFTGNPRARVDVSAPAAGDGLVISPWVRR